MSLVSSAVLFSALVTLPGRQSGLLPEPPKSRPLSWSPVFGRKMQEEMLHRHPEEFEDSFESTMELSEWAEHLVSSC